MKKLISVLGAIAFITPIFAASPAYENFKTGVFQRNGNNIDIKAGATNAAGATLATTADIPSAVLSTLTYSNLPALNIQTQNVTRLNVGEGGINGNGSGLTGVNASTWAGMTNYTTQALRFNTNIIYISGSASNEVNDLYGWNFTQNTFTNSKGCGFDYQYEALKPYITNTAQDYIHQAVNDNQLTAWDAQIAGAGSPVGVLTNETFTATGLRSSSGNYLTDYPEGLTGSILMFGDVSTYTNYYGPYWTAGSAVFDTRALPIAMLSSLEASTYGPFHTIASSYRVSLRGQRSASIASGFIDSTCTNADLSIISSEFGLIRNGQGIASFVACGSFADYSASGTYANIASSTFTNLYMHFSALLGANGPGGGAASSLNSMDTAVGIGSGGSTNFIDNSVVIGQWQSNSNLSKSIVIGRQHKTVNATNVYLLGEGLTTTSNNVVKVGFPGWHLLLTTNRFQLISNNVAFNVGLTPAP